MIRNLALLAMIFVIGVAVLAFITKMPGETTWELTIGWAAFIERSFRHLTVNWNGVATAIACIALLLVGGHPFLKWLAASLGRGKPHDSGAAASNQVEATTATSPWPLKRTVQLLIVFMLLFVAGTAFIGLVHQVAWLAAAPEPLTRYRLWKHAYFNSDLNLKWSIAMGFNTYRDVNKQLPPNGTAPQLNQGSHSWLTRILPFANVYRDKIDMALDWDDPKNAPGFQRFADCYLNPDIGVLREARGYAVSHYAGNSRFFSHQPPITPEALTKGAANVILCGEVVSDFAAWGDPANLRDPADGVNRVRQGFGSTDERGANVLMLDGSVRFLSTDTAPDVLATLATPQVQ